MKILTAYSSALAAGAIMVGGHGSASGQTVQVGVGAEYTTGDYGGTSETIIYEAPVTVRVRTGDWSFRIRVPFASIEGPGGVVVGGPDDSGGTQSGSDNSGSGSNGSGGSGSGGSGSGGSGGGGSGGSGGGGGGSGGGGDDPPGTPVPPVVDPTPTRNEGLADISLSATWSKDLGADNYLDITGRVTLPTGDKDKNLGTGETDYTLIAELGHDFDGGGIYAFGGYKFRGGAAREDGGQLGAGGYLRVLESVITGIDAGWSESSLAGGDQAADLTAYVSFPVFTDWRLSTYALAGLTENAPDYGVGVTLTWRTDLRRPTEQ